MAKNYYDILGVGKSASTDEIKKAYRKLAMQHHPDRGGEHNKFKEVNEAYQVLSNPQKRAQYDQFGEAGVGAGFDEASGFGAGGFRQGAGASFDFQDIFGNGFGFGGGVGDIFENFFGASFSQVQAEISVSLPQAVLGDKVRFKTQQGEEIELEIPAGTQDGQSFRIKNKGLAYKRGRGDLIMTIRVTIPKHLSREEKELYEQLKELEHKKHSWKFWQ